MWCGLQSINLETAAASWYWFAVNHGDAEQVDCQDDVDEAGTDKQSKLESWIYFVIWIFLLQRCSCYVWLKWMDEDIHKNGAEARKVGRKEESIMFVTAFSILLRRQEDFPTKCKWTRWRRRRCSDTTTGPQLPASILVTWLPWSPRPFCSRSSPLPDPSSPSVSAETWSLEGLLDSLTSCSFVTSVTSDKSSGQLNII